MSHRRSLLAAASLGCLLVAHVPTFAAGSTTYDFSTVSGSSSPLSLNGATFTSPGDPGAYVAGPNGGLFETLPTTVLTSAGVAAELDIAFAAPVNAISFNFALGDFLALNADDSLMLRVDGAAPIAFLASLGADALFPAGAVSFSGAGFSQVSLTSTEPLAIGNLATVATIAAVPEPSSAWLIAIGLGGLVGWQRRRRT